MEEASSHGHPHTHGGGGANWSAEEKDRLEDFILKTPDKYLDEIRAWLLSEMGRSITESGLYKLLKKMDLSLKVLVKIFHKSSEKARVTYWIEHQLMGLRPEQCVFTDEMTTKTGDMYRKKGRGAMYLHLPTPPHTIVAARLP